MAGTVAGGKLAAQTNMAMHGADFYRRIGSKGGSVPHPTTRPFYKDRKLARRAAAKGGRISRALEGTVMSEVPLQPERQQYPRPNEAQEASLRAICGRYQVEYRDGDYFVYPENAWMMPGWAEGFVGGKEIQATHPTIYCGVSPEGQVHT